MAADLRCSRPGLRRDSDLAGLEAGSDPFQQLVFAALNRNRGAVQAGQWPDAAGSLQANTEPPAPVRKKRQAVQVSESS